MQIPEARWIVFGTLLLFAMMLAWYVVSYFRNLAFGSDSDESTELLTGFVRCGTKDNWQMMNSRG